MKNAILLLPAFAAVIVTGCADFGTYDAPVYSDLTPNGYYTGEVPHFSEKGNPDPRGRTFRIAYLQTIFDDKCPAPDMAKKRIESHLAMFANPYMGLREQLEKKSYSGQLLNLQRKVAISQCELWEIVNNGVQRGYTSHPEDAAFAAKRHDLDGLNAELERRYPQLFSTSKLAFPLDVVICGAFSSGRVRTRSLYEAWCIGLPEHAILEGDWYHDGMLFKAEEGWISPYDAIAAALFKLSAEQFEGLEPANPNDHFWLER